MNQKVESLGITMAEHIWRLGDQDSAGGRTNADLSSIIGIGHSGGSDIAAEGQAVTAEAISLDADFSVFRFGRDKNRAFTVHS